MSENGKKSMEILQVPLCKPDVGNEELNAVGVVFQTGQLSHGPSVSEFEMLFASRINCAHAISLNSCTSGLYLAFSYIHEKFGKGEVIVPSFTFVASANAIVCADMIPRFAETNWETGNISADLIAPLINKKTKAIMVVHYAGRPCNMSEIMQLAGKHNLPVIEDSAECLGAKIAGKEVGSFGVGVFSFYSTKNITTGEGGMITTNDKEFADWCRLKLAHGIQKKSYVRKGIKQKWFRNAIIPGQNFRLANFQAAMGIVQLNKLDKMNEKRRIVAEKYIRGLFNIKSLELPELLPKGEHSWQMFPIKVPAKIRDNVLLVLNEKGIGASAHFDPPVHWQTAYQSGIRLPVTEKLALSTITLPISSVQTEEQTERVISILKTEMIK